MNEYLDCANRACCPFVAHTQVHDFWHVLTGCHTNVFGELALKALEFVQVSRTGGGLCSVTYQRCCKARPIRIVSVCRMWPPSRNTTFAAVAHLHSQVSVLLCNVTH